ncbi:hypothetical protein [Caballeronia sp. AZ7_KS35]|uniref:hypothetical protein n=1 Tax=Caballeronia sp. AZ7_KS35 TaxID=2921762 RepID=UPI0020284D16|nr:hypothetical protein [Caballeronia sp. AZ7_KS35]
MTRIRLARFRFDNRRKFSSLSVARQIYKRGTIDEPTVYVRLLDLIAFFVLTYLIVSFLIVSFATTMLGQLASWPDPERWIAIFVVCAVAITCAIKIGPISRCLVDMIRMPFDRSKE